MKDNSSIILREADRIEVLTLVDNYADVLLQDTEIVTRPLVAAEGRISSDTLLAEHGLSLLVRVYEGEKRYSILFDAGYSSIALLHNMSFMGIDPTEIAAIVLSHGHMDHTGAVYNLLDNLPSPVPVVVHPDVFISPRYLETDSGSKIMFPPILSREGLEARGVDLIESREPSILADGKILVTGEIERNSSFEKGLPNALIERDGQIEGDPMADDQAVVANLKGKGLVVISGCSHSGIINTLSYSVKITGVAKIHAVMGGFHLTGPLFEQIIENTVRELKAMAPDVVVPMHCTGRKAAQRFSEKFPGAFVLNSVGSIIGLS